ncbi:hypothetical protein ACIA49_34010 [Kribbella sp. NPDC051587]|uniref:hypothetical protein n=1 Tax=Kribbella sp. NPDC051587 TaxID=3364119 RepID=UPI0037A94A39
MRHIAAVIVAAGLVLTGCSTVKSKDIRTSGMSAGFVVTVDDNEQRAVATASLRSGTLTYVDLGDGESISVTGSGAPQQLRRQKSLGTINYTSRLNDVLNAGTEITFALQRDSANESAPKSTVALPERVHLTAPTNSTTYSRQQPVPIRFETAPTDQQTILSWSGSCVTQGRMILTPGASSTVIPAGMLKANTTTTSASPGQAATRCSVEITLTREVEGRLDPAFKDGSVRAQAVSKRSIVSTP